MNIKLKIAYEGTAYFGWQKTPTGPSIEETLERAMRQILQAPIELQAASRTDRGVHALGQVVNANLSKSTPLDKLRIGLNALLPPDIVVREIVEMPAEFHATLHAKSKEYSYEMCYGHVQLPRHRRFSWHFHYPLRLDLMRKATEFLTGTHDFSAFCNQKNNETYSDHVRRVDCIKIEEIDEERILITLQGTHFLYKMVRNLVGTLAYVGVGKIEVSMIPEILDRKERLLSGVTAPAHGLTLKEVHYG